MQPEGSGRSAWPPASSPLLPFCNACLTQLVFVNGFLLKGLNSADKTASNKHYFFDANKNVSQKFNLTHVD